MTLGVQLGELLGGQADGELLADGDDRVVVAQAAEGSVGGLATDPIHDDRVRLASVGCATHSGDVRGKAPARVGRHLSATKLRRNVALGARVLSRVLRLHDHLGL